MFSFTAAAGETRRRSLWRYQIKLPVLSLIKSFCTNRSSIDCYCLTSYFVDSSRRFYWISFADYNSDWFSSIACIVDHDFFVTEKYYSRYIVTTDIHTINTGVVLYSARYRRLSRLSDKNNYRVVVTEILFYLSLSADISYRVFIVQFYRNCTRCTLRSRFCVVVSCSESFQVLQLLLFLFDNSRLFR